MRRTDYLKGKTLLVTGISKGIGRALAQQGLDAGMTVVGWGLTAPDYADERLHFFACDVSDPAQVETAAEQTKAIAPAIDYLVNNAGFGHFSKIGDFDPEVFKRMWEVNVYGTFLVSRAVVPGMLERKSGHIVNVSSIAGRVGAAWGAGYNASKFAVTGMGESLFHELRKEGIKVSNVYPGSTATHFFDEIPGVEANPYMLDPADLAESILHLMDSPPNYLVREIEIRPLRSKPPK